MFDTRKMKKTTTWTLWRRLSLARSTGRIMMIEAPVVPTKLAISVPIASSAVLVAGVPCRLPMIRMPPAMVNSAKSRMMKGMYSSSAVCASAPSAGSKPRSRTSGTSTSSAQKAANLP